MPDNTIPFPTPPNPPPPNPPEPLLTDIQELSRRLGLSVRTLRRMDAAQDIPGRVVVGRRVLFQVEVIREWVRLGLPDRQHWETLQRSRRAGK